MLQNYLKTIWRNLSKKKFYSFINIVGLSIGIAAVIGAFQNYRYGMSYNKWHKDGEKIFRVLSKSDASENWKGIAPIPLAAVFRNDNSNISQTMRMADRTVNIRASRGRNLCIAGSIH